MQDSVTVSNGFEVQVPSYSISYKDSNTDNICTQITTVPSISCADNGVCEHTFKVSSSRCHPSTNITVTVIAMSMFGSGLESAPQMIGTCMVSLM